MKQGHAEPRQNWLKAATGVPQAIQFRHLRYFVAVADAGTFTQAAEQMFIAQPTLSQQIRRLEEMVGTPLLRRRREGLRLTPAGPLLLEESRVVLSIVDHGVRRAWQAAGLGGPPCGWSSRPGCRMPSRSGRGRAAIGGRRRRRGHRLVGSSRSTPSSR